jgi:hypothetical protein
MKIVAFIEEPNIIEKILRHSFVPSRHTHFGLLRSALHSSLSSECELWKEIAPHPPPVKSIGPPKTESGPSLDYRFTSTKLLSACFKQNCA